MTGESLIPQGDGTQVAQSLRIATTEGGAITYHAQIAGRSPLSFPMIRRGETEVMFENPAHLAPKRIAYHRDDDALTVTLYTSVEDDARGWRTQFRPCSSL